MIKYSLRVLNLIFAVILLLLFSFFIIKLNDSLKEIKLFVFLEENLDDERIAEIKESLKGLKEVRSIQFSSPEDTAKAWAETLKQKELLKAVGGNVFPPLFRIKLQKGRKIKRLRQAAEAVGKIEGVEAVEYGGRKTESVIKRIKRFISICVLVFFAALINIFDHIFIFSRKNKSYDFDQA